MTILVTGGAGFIGSHLTERLLADGESVHVVDDLRSAVWDAADLRARGASYSLTPIQHYHEGNHFDAIYHLASPVGPAGVLPYAGTIVADIIEGACAVSTFARAFNCRLVFISTSEVYNSATGLCSEDMDCHISSAPSARLEYAVGKLAAEVMLRNMRGLDVVIIRPFNIAGPRQSGRGGFVLPRFVQQATELAPLTVFGDGTAVRAFTHVGDIVDGLVLAMKKGQRGEVYNLGNPANKITIRALAQSVIEAIPGPLGGGFVKYMDGRDVYGPDWRDASDKFPDATKAISELGWQPTRTVDEIIRDVIEYERSKIHVD